MARRILIADDHEYIRSMLVTILTNQGYNVTTAENGEEALRAVEDVRPDLILLDIQMPGIDGCQVCRHLKSQANTRHIPVMMISGMADTRDRARAANADGYMNKPFNLTDLYRNVRDLLTPAPVLAWPTASDLEHEPELQTA